MKSLSIWDIALLFEALVFIVFILLVTFEFCSSTYSIDTSLGSEVRKTIYLFVFIGSLFRLVAIICHVFLVLPDYCRFYVVTMLEESTNLIFITGLSLQVVFLVQIYYALLGLLQPAIRKVFISVIMSTYIIVFAIVSLCLFIRVDYMLKCIHLVITALCIFCLISLIIYGRQIYTEMKRLDVSKNIVRKMIIILTISSFTFFLRALIESLFIFGVIILDFDTNSDGSMHMIGSHLYASAMYFFFYYFLAEINPLSILLLSTYIRTRSVVKSTTSQDKGVLGGDITSPGQSTDSLERIRRSTKRFFRRSDESFNDTMQSLLSSPLGSVRTVDIQLSSHWSSKKTL